VYACAFSTGIGIGGARLFAHLKGGARHLGETGDTKPNLSRAHFQDNRRDQVVDLGPDGTALHEVRSRYLSNTYAYIV
jgi:hypothetical protein